MNCKHCSREMRVNAGRGLCYPCYYVREIRGIYPARYGMGKRFNEPRRVKPPTIPTVAAPGTEAKLATLANRVKRGESLFHPADARLKGDPTPLKFLANCVA